MYQRFDGTIVSINDVGLKAKKAGKALKKKLLFLGESITMVVLTLMIIILFQKLHVKILKDGIVSMVE